MIRASRPLAPVLAAAALALAAAAFAAQEIGGRVYANAALGVRLALAEGWTVEKPGEGDPRCLCELAHDTLPVSGTLICEDAPEHDVAAEADAVEARFGAVDAGVRVLARERDERLRRGPAEALAREFSFEIRGVTGTACMLFVKRPPALFVLSLFATDREKASRDAMRAALDALEVSAPSPTAAPR
jgi:hypothetical protein